MGSRSMSFSQCCRQFNSNLRASRPVGMALR
jgi:hypothetical protein